MLLIVALIGLLGGHAIADYGLQSSYMAEHKVRRPDNRDWWVTLSAHCLIHALMVLAVSMAVLLLGMAAAGESIGGAIERISLVVSLLALAEFVLHFTIDTLKGHGKMSYRMDQGLHYLCKLLWVGAISFNI